MRFMLMDRVRPGTDETAMPTDEQMAAMGTFIEEKQGVLHSTEGLHPTGTGVRVTLTEDGETAMAKGPFTDSISNFAIIHADSEEEAIAHAKAWLKIWGKGETEIRRVVEEEDVAEMMQR